MTVSVMLFKGKVIGIDLPAAVELRVVETDPGVRGDTATGGPRTRYPRTDEWCRRSPTPMFHLA